MFRRRKVPRDVPTAKIAGVLAAKLEVIEHLLESPLAPHNEDYLNGYADAVVAILLELSENG